MKSVRRGGGKSEGGNYLDPVHLRGRSALHFAVQLAHAAQLELLRRRLRREAELLHDLQLRGLHGGRRLGVLMHVALVDAGVARHRRQDDQGAVLVVHHDPIVAPLQRIVHQVRVGHVARRPVELRLAEDLAVAPPLHENDAPGTVHALDVAAQNRLLVLVDAEPLAVPLLQRIGRDDVRVSLRAAAPLAAAQQRLRNGVLVRRMVASKRGTSRRPVIDLKAVQIALNGADFVARQASVASVVARVQSPDDQLVRLEFDPIGLRLNFALVFQPSNLPNVVAVDAADEHDARSVAARVNAVRDFGRLQPCNMKRDE